MKIKESVSPHPYLLSTSSQISCSYFPVPSSFPSFRHGPNTEKKTYIENEKYRKKIWKMYLPTLPTTFNPLLPPNFGISSVLPPTSNCYHLPLPHFPTHHQFNNFVWIVYSHLTRSSCY